MQEHEKTLWTMFMLIVSGAIIGIGKLLTSSEKLTIRLISGRAILGSATSSVAGIVLLQIPNIHPIALLALGSALGIAGAGVIESYIKKRAE
ncbi:TPA: holin [Acinetobacter nosocomialis]|uniref:holin n=1 Tax=Acinetobacter nosocomialis TaxID=106654 RepID=UPI0002DCDF0E|nr:holin [Acinetobacter nosocomialis]AWL20193.1 holin [Acinetobacter nosocomialis]RSN88713.1 holin [Acinetobacter nosocomialis]HAV4987991.1 holin [Acinetobacter nosocomialis]